MASFTLTRQIAAGPDAVFGAITDVDALPKRIPEIVRAELITPGPIGVGSRIRETRKMFGKEATETFEVTAFDPGRRFTMTAHSCGVAFQADHRFAPDAGGTRLELEMTMRPVSLFAKLMTPFGWLMQGMMKKSIAKDLDRLAAAVEAAPAVA